MTDAISYLEEYLEGKMKVKKTKAEDTQMDELRLWSILEDEKEKAGRSIILVLRKVRDEQAEISFKAGYEQREKEMSLQLESLSGLLNAHKQQGIREVVEWIKKNFYISPDNTEVELVKGILIKVFSAWIPQDDPKLKEWGL